MKEGWTYKKLGEVCSKSRNIKWDIVSDTATYKYIDLTSVDRGDLCIHNPQTISKADAPSRAKQIVELGDVILATTRPTLRRVSLIDDVFNGAICSTGFCVLRPNKDISSKWIFYGLQNNAFYNYIEPLQTGASYPAVTDSIVKAYTLPIPPLSEQQSIVDYIDSAFAKIDAMKANAEKALNEAKALFQTSLKEMLEPKEGWEEKTLKDVSVIYGNYGLSVPSTEFNGVRYLRITDITELGDLNDEKVSAKLDEEKEQELLEEGDILFARTGATVGKTLMYKEAFGKCLFAGYLIRYRLNKEIVLPKFVFYITHSDNYYKWVLENQKAAAQPNISAKLYNEYNVSYPPLSEQQSIVDTLDSLKSKVDKLQENYDKISQECDALKQAILRQIFE